MNLNGKLYEDLRKENTKIAKKILDDLNAERYWCVITYGTEDIWNFERSHYSNTIPIYVVKYLTKYIYKHYGISYFYFGRFKNYKHLIEVLKEV